MPFQVVTVRVTPPTVIVPSIEFTTIVLFASPPVSCTELKIPAMFSTVEPACHMLP